MTRRTVHNSRMALVVLLPPILFLKFCCFFGSNLFIYVLTLTLCREDSLQSFKMFSFSFRRFKLANFFIFLHEMAKTLPFRLANEKQNERHLKFFYRFSM